MKKTRAPRELMADRVLRNLAEKHRKLVVSLRAQCHDIRSSYDEHVIAHECATTSLDLLKQLEEVHEKALALALDERDQARAALERCRENASAAVTSLLAEVDRLKKETP